MWGGGASWVLSGTVDRVVLLSAAGLVAIVICRIIAVTLDGDDGGRVLPRAFATLVPFAFLLVFFLFLVVTLASLMTVFIIDELHAEAPARLHRPVFGPFPALLLVFCR